MVATQVKMIKHIMLCVIDLYLRDITRTILFSFLHLNMSRLSGCSSCVCACACACVRACVCACVCVCLDRVIVQRLVQFISECALHSVQYYYFYKER